MKNKALIVISTLVILEVLFYLVHQFVMKEPYINAYILIPVFFLLAEGAFVVMSSVKWTGKMINLWFFVHKIKKRTPIGVRFKIEITEDRLPHRR